MGQAAAHDWNAEHTDAKGYWVATKCTVESLAGLDFIDTLDVPEFTLSGSEPAQEQPVEEWEVLDTQVPEDSFEVTAPTDEAPRVPSPRKSNVIVAGPGRPAAAMRVAPPAAAPTPSPVERRMAKADRSALAAEMVRKAKAASMSVEDRRALATKMAREAKQAGVVRLADHRPPGSLPPMEELSKSGQVLEHTLPELSRENWSWDEADPLAVAALPERPHHSERPERPSLSVVRAAPESTDAYGDVLATPLPSPPRPSMSLPWPLPMPRPSITMGDAMQQPFPMVEPSIDLSEELMVAPPEPQSSSVSPLLIAGAVVAGLVACGALAVFTVLATATVTVLATL